MYAWFTKYENCGDALVIYISIGCAIITLVCLFVYIRLMDRCEERFIKWLILTGIGSAIFGATTALTFVHAMLEKTI